MADATCSASNIGFNWPASWGTSGVLKIIADREFVSGGKPYPAGRISDPIDQNFCYQSAITVVSDVATFAAITLPQTDALDIQVINGSGTPLYTAIIYSNDGNTKRQILFSGWHLSSSLGSTFNFAAWATDNNAPTVINPRSQWVDIDTLNRALAAIAYAPASTTQLGLVKTSYPSVDSALPIALEQNDPRVGSWYNILTFGARTTNTAAQNTTAIATAIAAALAAGGGVYIPVGTFLVNGLTFSVPVQFAPGDSILQRSAGTITFQKMMMADASQHFVAATGQVVFTVQSFVYPEWWNTAGTTTQTMAAFQAAVDTGKPVLLVNDYILNNSSSALMLNNNTTRRAVMIGIGFDSCSMEFTSSANPGITIDYIGTGNPSVELRSFTMRGSTSTPTAGAYGILHLGGASHGISQLIIHNLKINVFGDNAIRLQGSTGPAQVTDIHIYDVGDYGIKITEDSANLCPQNVTISGGAIQGDATVGGISADGVSNSGVNGLIVQGVDIELGAGQTKPCLYMDFTFGATITGLTASSTVDSLSVGDANIYLDSNCDGNYISSALNVANGGLHNIHDFGGTNFNNTFIGGFFRNSATPPAGLGYYAKTTSAIRDVFINPLLGTFAVGQNLVKDTAPNLVMAFGVRTFTKSPNDPNALVAPAMVTTDLIVSTLLAQGEGASLTVTGPGALSITNNLHRVTGSGNVLKNISVPGAFASPTGGRFTAIPLDTYTYDGTGNIVVPSGGGTAVIGQSMTFTYLPSTGKWYPSY